MSIVNIRTESFDRNATSYGPVPRWKWMFGSMAVGTVAAVDAEAGIVQINLLNNFVSSSQIHMDGDITDDGNSDLNLQGLQFTGIIASTGMKVSYGVRFYIDSARICSCAFRGLATPITYVIIWGERSHTTYDLFGDELQSDTRLISISFSDLRINKGFPTDGWLEVRAFNTSNTSHTIELVRTIFDNESTVAPGGVSVGANYPEFSEDEADILIDTVLNSTREAEKRAAFAKLKKLKNGLKKLKKKLKKAPGAKKKKFLKKIKSTKKRIKTTQAAFGVRG